MKRYLVFTYGLISYVIGLGGLVYFILFVGGWTFIPRHIESDPPAQFGVALLINTGLMLLFGLQHSMMARPSFKKQITKIIPKAAERSTYVLLSGGMMLLISFFWQPVEGYLWQVTQPFARNMLTIGYIFGWVFAVLSSFVINHFELFGLRQVYYNLINQPEPAPNFTARFLYSIVRHPLQLGVLIGIWTTHTMSLTHLFLAIAFTGYIFVGLYFEEKDLTASLGQAYTDYQKRVPKILPFPRPNKPKTPVQN